MAYEFHYTPTGTGVISGKEVLEQTEDAINDLGNTAISGVQEALDKAEQALTNSANAVDDAQTALNTANNAEGVAIQAQNDVSTLSGTVTNIGNRVTTAEGNISNLQGRMTTAEGNVTNLQGRMTTAEGNIGNLQTAVSTAQATANSAQQTATTARQQSYVFRYSSTALTASSTNSNALLDNTDNLKVGDKVIDSSGVLFSITAIDTANSTFTIGTALIDLALDSDVVHKSGNETVGGAKTFSDSLTIYNNDSSQSTKNLTISSSKIQVGDTSNSDSFGVIFNAGLSYVSRIMAFKDTSATQNLQLGVRTKDSSNNLIVSMVRLRLYANGFSTFESDGDNLVSLGSSSNKWKNVQTYQVNNLEPSSLSLPDLSNGIDISGYITNFGAGTVNEYTPVADGWISIASSGDSPVFIRVYNDYGFEQVVYSERNEVGGTTGGTYTRFGSLMIPCVKNVKIYIIVSPSTSVLVSAKFFPCLGNV